MPQCPGANAIFQNDYMVHNVNDKVGKDTWHKELLVDGGFTGEVSIDIFAPLPLTFGPDGVPGFTSSVTWCSTKWQNEMGGELCMANGNQWTVFVDGSGEPITLTIYPGFGMGVGETTEMFPAMYSPQLNNTRKVPVYVPPTLLQNKVPRPVNIMFILDGSQEVLEKFTTNGGFESAQIAGFVPEYVYEYSHALICSVCAVCLRSLLVVALVECHRLNDRLGSFDNAITITSCSPKLQAKYVARWHCVLSVPESLLLNV